MENDLRNCLLRIINEIQVWTPLFDSRHEVRVVVLLIFRVVLALDLFPPVGEEFVNLLWVRYHRDDLAEQELLVAPFLLARSMNVSEGVRPTIIGPVEAPLAKPIGVNLLGVVGPPVTLTVFRSLERFSAI
jgi:hypothetical protein